MEKKDIIAATIIFAITLFVSLLYSFRDFEITSDSYLEYLTFLQYAELGKWWRPLTDNMLSVCIWTTYIPAQIQQALRIANPETVYRVWIGFAVSFAPVMLYIFARRYTTIIFTAVVVVVFITSEYFSGHATYARLIVSITWNLLLIYAVTDSKPRYWLLVLAAWGLFTSHYTTTFVYMGILSVSVAVWYIVNRLRGEYISTLKSKVICLVSLFTGIIGYYGILGVYTRVLHYFYGAIKGAFAAFGINLPNIPAPTPPASAITDFTPNASLSPSSSSIVPPSRAGIQDEAAIPNGEYIKDRFTLNPFEGERLDFIVADITVLLRGMLAGLLLYKLTKRGEWRNLFYYIYGVSVLVSLAGIWLPSAASVLGSMRLAFYSLPIELIAVSIWHDGDTRRNWAILPLLLSVFVYH